MRSLQARLTEAATGSTDQGGRTRKLLSPAAILSVAQSTGLTPRQVEIAALREDMIPERYLRNFDAYSHEEQVLLLESRVFQVGLGGLGGHLLDELLRAGVGTITALDGDVFEPHNLNRQLLATESTIGRPKAEAARERAEQVNPSVRFMAHHAMLDVSENGEVANSEFALELERSSLVADGLGGLADRLGLQNAAARAELPMVTAAVAGFSGWVATVLPGHPGPADFLGSGAADEDVLGTPAPTVALAATLQANEILNILCGRGPALAGKMLLFDLRQGVFQTVTL